VAERDGPQGGEPHGRSIRPKFLPLCSLCFLLFSSTAVSRFISQQILPTSGRRRAQSTPRMWPWILRSRSGDWLRFEEATPRGSIVPRQRWLLIGDGRAQQAE
jgi:hypothetical protein